MVSFLIIKGCNITICTIDEFTPLQLAVINGSTDILGLLLDQKRTDINQVTSQGTALHLAVMKEDLKCIELLLKHQADIETLDVLDRKAV